MKTEIQLRESALIIASKITPFKNFEEVAKIADKVLAYMTKDGELKIENPIESIMGAITPLIYGSMCGVSDATNTIIETEHELKDDTKEVEPNVSVKKNKS